MVPGQSGGGPGIDRFRPGVFKIGNVPRGNCHAMHKRSGRYQRVQNWALVWHVESRAAQGDCRIDGQNTPSERG
jgi:hypothetical protein